MYRNDFDPPVQDAAGLDMFVGSGIDFLSEVTMEDMDKELFNSNLTVPWLPDHHLSPQNLVDFAPLAASLGPPGTTTGLDYRTGTLGTNHSPQRPLPAELANAAAFPLGMQVMHRHMYPHIETCVKLSPRELQV